MSLNFCIHRRTIVNAGWSYAGFNAFRQRLVDAPLPVLGNFRHACEMHPMNDLFWGNFKSSLMPLINHSDCDGELDSEECAQVEPALRRIIETWPEDDADRIQATRLCDAMRHCAETGDVLEFC